MAAKIEIPEELKKDLPQNKWGKIIGATPIVMTVIATMLAGLASSEMTKAQYDAAYAASIADPDGFWGKEAARHLSVSRHVVFRAQGHGVSSQDPCAARLRDEFLVNPDPRAVPPCRTNAPPDFAAASERAKSLP